MGLRTTGRHRVWVMVALLGLLSGALAEEARIPLVAGATDPEGDKLTCEWTQTAGPKARIDQPKQLATFFVPSEPGEYVFEIRVSDGEYTVSDKVTFVVKPPNKPPVATATGPRKLMVGEPVLLDGSKSRDPDGEIRQYRWVQSSGPSVKIPAPGLEGPQLAFEPTESGEYVFELTVFDGKLWSRPARVAFVVSPPNRKPKISLQTGKQEIEWPGTGVAATGTGPKVPEVTTKPETPVVSPPKTGRMPIADAGRGGTLKLGEDIVLDASASKDPLGEELTYRWEQRLTDAPILHAIRHDPTSAKGALRGPDHCPVWRCRPAKAGVYDFELVVTAGKDKKRKAVAAVTYRVAGKEPPAPKKENRPPSIEVPASVKGKVGTEVRIEAVVSDPENDPVDVSWTIMSPAELFVPDQALAQRTLVFTPVSKGLHVFGVVAKDAHGRSEPKQVRVEVAGSAPILTVKKPGENGTPKKPVSDNHPPVAAMQPFGRPVEVGKEGMLDGTLSSDQDGHELTYRWRVVEGGACVELIGVDQPHLTVRGRKPGQVKIELVVNDGKVDSAPAFLTTEIEGGKPKPPPAKPPVAKCELISKPPFLTGAPLIFSAVRSSDPAEKALSYHWKAVGSNARKLALPTDAGENLTITPDAPGEYTIELRVSNGEADSKTVSVTFAVEEPKRKPVAVIAPVEPCEAGQKVLLDGTPSQSVRGKSLKYRWECVTQPKDAKVSFGWTGASRSKPTPRLPKPGEYVFQLKVTEDGVESDPVRVTVRTRAPNRGPRSSLVAIAGFMDEDLKRNVDLLKLPHVRSGESITVEEGWPILLDASGSTDPDGGPKPMACTWKQIGGPGVKTPEQDGLRLRFKAPAEGTVVFEVVLSDGKDFSAPAQATLKVLKAKTIPVAVPRAYVNPPSAPAPATPPQRTIEIPAFKRMAKITPADPVLILDGVMSTYTPRTGQEAGLSYIWKQIGGEDLQLREEKLNKPRVGLLVYHPGRYRFMLLVNDGRYRSLPAVVDVVVTDPSLKGTKLIEDDKKADKPERKPESKVEGKVEGKPEGKVVGKAQSRDDRKAEEEGALLPPPKDAGLPAVAAKSPVKPDPVAMLPAERQQGEVLLASADGGSAPNVHPSSTPAGTPQESQPPGNPETFAKLPALDPIPGKVTERVQTLLRKNHRADDPVYQRQKRNAEMFALKSGADAEGKLILMLSEKDDDLRAIAALALVQRGLGSVPALVRQLQDRKKTGLEEAHWALQQLSHKKLPPDAASWKKWWSELLSQ